MSSNDDQNQPQTPPADTGDISTPPPMPVPSEPVVPTQTPSTDESGGMGGGVPSAEENPEEQPKPVESGQGGPTTGSTGV